MARYEDDDQGGNSRSVLVVILLLALLGAGGGLYFWRSQSGAPLPPQQTASSEAATPDASPGSTSKPGCTPATGAAGVFELHFDFDKSDIKPAELRWIEDAANAYSDLARSVADCPEAKLEAIVRLDVVGHADTAGPRDYNQKLSERRAGEVASQLERRGVPESQIRTHGVGEDDLAVDTPDDTPKAENRRAPITITVEAVKAGS